jgi:DNA-binding transcriptional regulator/RsmH inhibitor MraZ
MSCGATARPKKLGLALIGFAAGTELALVGKGDRFEIWNRADWQAQRAAVKAKLRERGLTLQVVANPGGVA